MLIKPMNMFKRLQPRNEIPSGKPMNRTEKSAGINANAPAPKRIPPISMFNPGNMAVLSQPLIPPLIYSP
jgi:hypothetical protein